jgi:hypothetical protein
MSNRNDGTIRKYQVQEPLLGWCQVRVGKGAVMRLEMNRNSEELLPRYCESFLPR